MPPPDRRPGPQAPQGLTADSIIVIVAAVLGIVLLLILASARATAPDEAEQHQAAAVIMPVAPVGNVAAPHAGCPAGAEDCVTIRTASGEHVFSVEWAVTTPERTCGLMFREEMAADHGMVFDFVVEEPVSFWMRNTLISLDMVFIRADGTVSNVAEHTTPQSLTGVPSVGPVRYVLELVAGTARRIGLRPGDHIDLARAPGRTEGTAVCHAPPDAVPIR